MKYLCCRQRCVLNLFFQNYFLPPINKFSVQNASSGHGIAASPSTEKDVHVTCCFQVPPEATKHFAIFSSWLSAKWFVKSTLCQCWEHRVKIGCISVLGRMLRMGGHYSEWRGRVFKGLWTFLYGNDLLRTLSSLLHWVATGFLS